MKQECPYLTDCKLPKRNDLCFNNMRYTHCIVYQRSKALGRIPISKTGLKRFIEKYGDNYLGIGATVNVPDEIEGEFRE